MIHDVKEFHAAMGQFEDQFRPAPGFYLTLIDEEYQELQEAVAAGDTVEELDACMDLIYVILGHCLQRGFDIQGAWDEVQRSNMMKVDPTTGKVRRREDGKILKPEGWKPPQLSTFITQEKPYEREDHSV